MFKDVGYEAAILEKRARAGKAIKDDPGPLHQPPATRSQSVSYCLMGVQIAVCHQYLLPDGTFGGSGKPDPKMLQYQGYVLFSIRNPKAAAVVRSARMLPRTGAK